MSASPSIPSSGPTLAEAIIRRVFARPPKAFVDGELLEALEHADAAEPVAVPVDPAREPRKGQRVDVRV
ncbi:MAG TPA: hypothetical protein VFT50_10910 [Baekduia sp.]|nr:hypothetical protein [Baekduia sp.]